MLTTQTTHMVVVCGHLASARAQPPLFSLAPLLQPTMPAAMLATSYWQAHAVPNTHHVIGTPAQGATHVGPHAPQQYTCSPPTQQPHSQFPHLRAAPAAAPATESVCTPTACHPPPRAPHRKATGAHLAMCCCAALQHWPSQQCRGRVAGGSIATV